MTDIKDHYEVLDVPRDADAAQIKKAHRKMALKYHPDKNVGNDESAAETFQYVQQAYECLSDKVERKWYDEHREAILRGWSAGDGDGGGDSNVQILFDVVPYMHPGCYSGYGDDEEGFYTIYSMVFSEIFHEEQEGWQSEGNIEEMPLGDLPTDFGIGSSDWSTVAGHFYTSWESFSSCRAFAWADKYDSKDAEGRRMRRAMDDENKKARRAKKRQFNEDILALVHFVKRRDPRVKAQKAKAEQHQAARREQMKQDALRKKQQAQEAREEWRIEAEERMAQTEADDMAAGRIRLADLDDDYDYGGGKRGKKSKKKRQQYFEEDDEDDEEKDESLQTESQQVDGEAKVDETAGGSNESVGITKEAVVNQEAGVDDEKRNSVADVDVTAGVNEEQQPEEKENTILEEDFDEDFESSSEEESEEEADSWRCECCRKDFKSEGQMENHMKSKKHKEKFKKWRNEHAVMEDLLDELAIDPE